MKAKTSFSPAIALAKAGSALFLLVFGLFGPVSAQPLFQKIDLGYEGDSRSVNWIDANGDGWQDLFITNGPGGGGDKNFLFINQKNGQFEPLAADPLVTDARSWDGATWADADNDGDADCFAVTWYGQPNAYYINDGTGHFALATGVFGGAAGTFSESAAWGDYDRDGRLDLYFTNSSGNTKNQLWRGLAGGGWEKILVGPHVVEGDPSRSANFVDADGDGWPDLFVSNESQKANDFFRNKGDGTFEKLAAPTVTTSLKSSMTSSWGDVDNDGDLDLFVGNALFYAPQPNQIWLNKGNGQFEETEISGPISTDGGCNYGSAFGDFDNDGDLDLAVGNGFCADGTPNFLYKNDGKGHFERDLASISDFSTPCTYGLAWADFDKNGFLDLAVSTCKNEAGSDAPADWVFKNLGNANCWLEVKLRGTVSNASAIGAKIRLKATIGGQSVWQFREVETASGQCGQNALAGHFGLGSATTADSIEVIFPSGIRQVLTAVACGQTVEIVEDATLPVVDLSDEKGAFLMKIWPNPASATAFCEAVFPSSPEKIRLRAVDSSGRVVFETTEKGAGRTAFSWPLEREKWGAAAGLFFIEIEADGKTERAAARLF